MKTRISWIYIFCGLIGILDTIIILGLNGGRNLGTLLPGVLGFVLLLWGLTGNYFKEHLLKKRFLRFRCLLRLGIVVFIASFVFIESLLLYNTKDSVPSQVDYIIILGAGLNEDQLSWTLWDRVDNGLRILQDNQEMKVVVSGGQGPGEWITEAEAMQRYLVEQGIAKERILKEEESTSTMENFRYSRELLEQLTSYQPSEPVLIITNDFHIFRSKLLARRNGLNPIGIPSPTPWYLRPNVYLREYFAIVKSLVFDR
jgi:uncharacterized SAM-binding protein YcdF (DUF218 family)